MSTNAWLVAGIMMVTGLGCGTRSSEGCEDEAKAIVAEAKPVVAEVAPVDTVPVEVVEAQPEAAAEQAPANAEALLADARLSMFQNPADGYAKAEASYAVAPTRDALFVMGFTACRLRDADKVRAAIDRFDDPDDATKMREHCEKKGVVL